MKRLPPLKSYFSYSFGGTLTHPLLWLCFGICACFLSLFSYTHSKVRLSRLRSEALYLKNRLTEIEKQEQKGKELLAQIKRANRGYLEQEIAPLQFLKQEREQLKALTLAHSGNFSYQNRLDFLGNGANTLSFREENFQRVGNLQEADLYQLHPVEMDKDDLQKLLALIENVSLPPYQPGDAPPYLEIQKFELIKKPVFNNEETFVVNFQLLKREAIHD